jgi:hypothetical protein
MGVRTKRILSIACILCVSVALMPQQVKHEGVADIAVVVNRDVPVSGLAMYQIRRIFRGEEKYWKSNRPIVVIVPASGTREREVMLHSIYKMNESQYKQFWIEQIFRAQAFSAPKIADSTVTANELVSSVSGCITLMSASEARPGTRILKIDNKLPGERGYPLR